MSVCPWFELTQELKEDQIYSLDKLLRILCTSSIDTTVISLYRKSCFASVYDWLLEGSVLAQIIVMPYLSILHKKSNEKSTTVYFQSPESKEVQSPTKGEAHQASESKELRLSGDVEV